MQTDADGILAAIGLVLALSIGYGKVVGPLQTDISQAFIDAFAVPTPYKRLLNLGVGLALAVAVAIIGAVAVDSWALVPAGVLAGVMASVEAARVHDQDGAFQAGVDTGIQEARTALRRVPPGGEDRRRPA